MRTVLRSLISLMNASFFVQFSNAAITTMIGINIAASGGSQSDVALVAGCYSLGFIIGCFVSPSRIQRVGLIRAFAAGAALLTITIVGLDLFGGVEAMALIRFVMGMSVALVLAVSDSWINLISPADKRGRVIAVYSIVLGAASIASQMVFLFLDSDASGFVLVFAITMNLSVVLVAMTSASAPEVVRVSGRSRCCWPYPLQSVATALAFDRAEEGNLPQTATTMLGLNSIGSILGPFTVMVLTSVMRDSALMVCILILGSVACLISLVKKASTEAPEPMASVLDASTNSVEMAEVAAELAEEQIEAHEAEESAGPELL